MNNVNIYCLIDSVSGEVRYVGKTVQKIRDRLAAHLCDKNRCHRTNWIASVNGKIEIKLIESCSIDEWQEKEKFWINHYRSIGARLTNQREGGGGLTTHSEEARKKISNKLKGTKNPCTPEKALAISIAKKGWNGLIGKKFTEEHRRNISNALKGRPGSNRGVNRNPEHTKKAMDSRMRNYSFPNAVKVQDRETGQIFKSKSIASKHYGVNIKTITKRPNTGNCAWILLK